MSCPSCTCPGCEAERKRWSVLPPATPYPYPSVHPGTIPGPAFVPGWLAPSQRYLCISCGGWYENFHACPSGRAPPALGPFYPSVPC